MRKLTRRREAKQARLHKSYNTSLPSKEAVVTVLTPYPRFLILAPHISTLNLDSARDVESPTRKEHFTHTLAPET